MIITIDTTKEVAPAEYAKMKGVSTSLVAHWMKRGKVKYRKIPELRLTLIQID